MADPKEREAAVASVEQACPRCGAPRGARQEYCIECGLRLPRTTGVLAGLRRRWIRRFGWYPGDWVWMSLLGLVVAVAGAAVAIALMSHSPKGGTTIVASPPATTTATATTTTTKLPTPPEPTTTTTKTKTKTTTPATTTTTATTTTAKPAAKTTTAAATTTTTTPSGETVWPAATSGWTIVLGSYPLSGGHAAAAATARRAANGGLAQVGVLHSGDWSSLHPGYYVVFSGIYASNAAAQAAESRARASGFGTSYVRQIVR